MTKGHHRTWGERIRAAREDAGYSIRGLAAASGVDQAYISRLEAGDKRNPSAEIILKLAGALGVDATPWLSLLGVEPSAALPPPRIYFRRKLGVNAHEADVLARLVEDYRAQHREVDDWEAL